MVGLKRTLIMVSAGETTNLKECFSHFKRLVLKTKQFGREKKRSES